jgi:hypothetical protein
MVKLNQNIFSPNDGEQHKNNNENNNIIKYRESNKDNILDLAEKHYENNVESLTNNAINACRHFPSSPIPHYRCRIHYPHS